MNDFRSPTPPHTRTYWFDEQEMLKSILPCVEIQLVVRKVGEATCEDQTLDARLVTTAKLMSLGDNSNSCMYLFKKN